MNQQVQALLRNLQPLQQQQAQGPGHPNVQALIAQAQRQQRPSLFDRGLLQQGEVAVTPHYTVVLKAQRIAIQRAFYDLPKRVRDQHPVFKRAMQELNSTLYPEYGCRVPEGLELV